MSVLWVVGRATGRFGTLNHCRGCGLLGDGSAAAGSESEKQNCVLVRGGIPEKKKRSVKY